MKKIWKIFLKQILHEDQLEWTFHCFLLSSYDYFEKLVNLYRTTRHWGRDSSFGTATRYGSGRSGDRIPMERGEIFSTRSEPPWGPPSTLYNGYRVFPGGKTARAWLWPPTPSTSEVKERVELQPYSPSGQGRIKLFGVPRQWKHFRPLFQAVFLTGWRGYYPPDSQAPRLPVLRQK